ncbi:MAG: hypothetical protein FWH34_06675 [Desulfovibrionaceae bacterium]|nr:hypothetical protein [Desulfovibrionaceae bacterium]
MEQMLLRLARQLDALDESSLMALWEKYAAIVAHFEPSQRWEEAALVLSFIQAKRWKNQLFNYHWARQIQLAQQNQAEGQTSSPDEAAGSAFSLETPEAPNAGTGSGKKRCQVLNFKPQKRD